MKEQEDSLAQLRSIKSMMEQSSRFISLSGWSGISAGICALIGAYFAHNRIDEYYQHEYGTLNNDPSSLLSFLVGLAVLIFMLALLSAFIFTWKKSRQNGVALWGRNALRLMWNTILPLLIGGVFILQLMLAKQYMFVAPACLLFYGLGLVNGSKYTLGEVRYLGYAQLILGLVNLFFARHGLLFWSLGFGICHIIYGIAMWWKYDRVANENKA